jgi:hypothetical protein
MRMLALAVFIPVFAASLARAEPKSPGEQFDSAMQQVFESLSLMLQAIPQYEMPEVLQNGDIIIRRVQPDQPPEEDGIVLKATIKASEPEPSHLPLYVQLTILRGNNVRLRTGISI